MDITARSEQGETGAVSRLRQSTAAWAALVAVIAFLPVREAVFPGRVFFVRDLHSAFWGLHLWFRREVFRGGSLLWDSYSGLGQPVNGDLVRQILFPPVVLLRLLLPETLGYNMVVAAAFPVAAVGMLLFLRGRLGRAASALGAVAFALSGPVLSTGYMPNLAWSVALMPWSMCAVDRLARERTVGRFSVTACAFALQFLAGEPVTLAATAALAVAFALFEGGWRAAAATVAAGVAGFLLAAVQGIPTIAAGVRAGRAGQTGAEGLHPLALIETVAPLLFGDAANARPPDRVFLRDMYPGGVPLLFSVYLGAGALTLAVVALSNARERARAWFWAGVCAAAMLCSLGSATPVYGALRAVVPVLNFFRFPSKYMACAAFAVAALAALGVDALAVRSDDGERPRLLAPAVWLGALGAAAVVALAWAVATTPDSPKTAFLAGSVVSSGRVLLLVVAALGLLLRLAASTDGGVAARGRALLFAVVAADLLAAGAGLNPTFDRSYFDEPPWVHAIRSDPDARVFIAAHGAADAGVDPGFAPPADDHTWVAAFYAAQGMELLPQAEGVGVRETWTTDYAALRPRDYLAASTLFWSAPPEVRARALQRLGARFQVVAQPPVGARQPIERIGPDGRFALYETPALPRASVVPQATFVPDTDAQFDVLVSTSRPVDGPVQVTGEEPPPAGVPRSPEAPSARVVSDLGSVVRLDASAPEGGGYLRLLDGFDPDWVASVDGAPAALLRADGVFRAVRLAPGRHEVVFAYRPHAFYAGCAVSAVTLLCLLAALAVARARAPRRESGAAGAAA